MKEHTQTMGIRKWAGDDLIELQKEPLDALQALVEPYAPCIIQGCVPTPNEDGKTYTVSSGFVALKGKIVRFEGKNNAMLPLYLGLECKTENRAYADGGNKPIKYQYVAKEVDKDTADDSCLTITVDDSANPHLVDTMGITQKLDREGGNASNVKVSFNTEGTDTEDLKSGNTLAKLFGAIKKLLSNIQKKIDGIEDGANNYTLPKASALVLGGIKTGFITNGRNYKVAVNSGNAYVNVPWTDTTYTAATQDKDGLMPKEDKEKLDAIAEGANNYTHPTNTARTGYPTANQTPGFGSTFSVSQVVSDEQGHVCSMNTKTIKIPNTAASQSAAGLMSSADKKKLDGIAEGANNYTLPQASSTVFGGIKLSSDNIYTLGEDTRKKVYLKGTGDKPYIFANEVVDYSTRLLGNITSDTTIYPGATGAIAGNNLLLTIGAATEDMVRTGARAYLYQVGGTSGNRFYLPRTKEVLLSANAKAKMTVDGKVITLNSGMRLITITWIRSDEVWIDTVEFGSVVYP